ncbi:hypothetical protein CSKR_202176 [Clonorchis sinensis]|uniref:LysM domain-containing protein n=1 Tax=Clonorchis sinensis TaxID=79923 RepID=A0A8T1LVU9_CLOSI|nr:hypothetical protein CSKR_202176 [Clonorchis sinensis]
MGEDVSILAGRRGKHYGTVGGCIRPAESYKLHYIEPDDTLVSIAVRYDTSVQHLKLLNHLWAADISNLRTLKVPAESPSMGHPLGDVELTPVRRKSASQKDECDEVPSATAYIRGLFERVQQAKESARSVLENSRLSEILSETNYNLQPEIRRSSQAVETPAVMVASSSSVSLNSQWRAPPNKPSCSTPETWNSNCDL